MAALNCALVRVGDAEESFAHLAPVLTIFCDHFQGHLGKGAGRLMSISQMRYGKIGQGLLGVTVLPPHKELQGIAVLADEDLQVKLGNICDSQPLLALEEPGSAGHVQGGAAPYADVVQTKA